MHERFCGLFYPLIFFNVPFTLLSCLFVCVFFFIFFEEYNVCSLQPRNTFKILENTNRQKVVKFHIKNRIDCNIKEHSLTITQKKN